tara:strand:+ start:3144 stop:3422 length:279 start_codon:yes stop_codon:yes gene_type:complete
MELDEESRRAIERKLPDWNPELVTRSVELEEGCPKCDEYYLQCFKIDLGRVDSEPWSAHVCLNDSCDYSFVREAQGVSFSDVETGRDYCLIC